MELELLLILLPVQSLSLLHYSYMELEQVFIPCEDALADNYIIPIWNWSFL